MSNPRAVTAQAFLTTFFDRPNKLTVTSKPEMAQWVARIDRPDPLPSVLPCWREGSDVDWYGLVFDARQVRALGESITAFVGVSHTTFRGQLARLDPDDPIEAAVDSFTEGRAYKFRGDDAKAIWAAIERMRKGWIRMGSRERAAPAPLGRVLRDFHMAIRAGLEDEAKSILELTRDEYHLDGLNLLYLHVEILASFRHWNTLLELPELPDLLRVRRPVSVTEALLQAVYNRHLAIFEPTSDSFGAISVFRAHVQSRFGSLLASRAGMHAPEVAKAFMLRAIASSPPDLQLRDELLALNELPQYDRAYLRVLSSVVANSEAAQLGSDNLSSASDAAAAADFDRAFSLARHSPLSVARARLLCECALELGTLEARGAAIEAVLGLDGADRMTFLSGRVNQRLWHGLSDPSEPSPETAREIEPLPNDWCNWIEHVDRNDGGKGAREIARRGAGEWSLSELFSRDGATEKLISLFRRGRSQPSEQAIKDSLPHLLKSFQQDPDWPNPGLREFYRLLLDLLVFSADGGRADLAVFNELLDVSLIVGVSGMRDYSELVAYATQLWSQYVSPATLDWAIDCLGVLVTHPCPAPDLRRSLYLEVLQRAVAFARHVDQGQRELLRLVGSDLGEANTFFEYFPPSAESEAPSHDPWAQIAGASIAIYTLNPRVARQVEQILEARVPGVRVSLCHDRVASARLKQLANQADLFILGTGSAKHAATDCVEANRPEDKPTLRPGGKGAASMLRALRKHAMTF